MDSLPSSVDERRIEPRSSAAQEMLHFRAGGLQLCLPLDVVAKVLPLMTLQAVPGAPPYLRGLMNLHGESIPVMDLAARLGDVRRYPYTLDTPILLCRSGLLCAGLIISEVLGVRSIENDARQMSETLADGGLPFVAVFNTDAGLALMLDSKRILDMGMSDDGTEFYVDPQELMNHLS